MRWFSIGESGQMTVEFAVVFPVMAVLAAFALHAMAYMGECARFDEVSRNAIRLQVEAASSPDEAVEGIERTVAACMAARTDGEGEGGSGGGSRASLPEGMRVSAEWTKAGIGHARYTVRLEMAPSLFGMPLREAFGSVVPSLRHETSMTVPIRRKAVVA